MEGHTPLRGSEPHQQHSPQRSSPFGSDFISLGSDNRKDYFRGRGRGRWGRGNRQWRISGSSYGTPRGHPSESSQPFYGSSMNSADEFSASMSSPLSTSGPERNFNHRNRNVSWNSSFRGGHSAGVMNDISCYYHPSMLENPWKDLEYLCRSADICDDSKDCSSSEYSMSSRLLDCEGSHSDSESSESS